MVGVGLLAAKYLHRRRLNRDSGVRRGGNTVLTPPPMKQLPRLSARTQLKPTRDIRSTDRCVSCRATGQGKSGGGWYVINGRTYCQDCAPGAAREANIDLIAPPQPVPTPPTTVAATTAATDPEILPLKNRIRTKMAPGQVKIQMGLDPDQKPVYYPANGFLLSRTSGKPTGLAITPVLRTEEQPNGDVTVYEDKTRWYLTHLASGTTLGPQPYASLEDAQGIAEILAQIDWTLPKDKVSTQDQQRALSTILLYNGLLSSGTAPEQAATPEQVAPVPPPITDAAPPTPASTPPAPSAVVDAPLPGQSSFPAKNLSRDLTGKLVADPMGGVSRVLADEGEVLFVVDGFGKRYEVYRDQVWAPRYEDFNTIGVAQPLNVSRTTPKYCSRCKSASSTTPVGQAWYRMDFKTFCPSCAPGYAQKEGWELDLGTIDSEVK